jgi:hypothetical protein
MTPNGPVADLPASHRSEVAAPSFACCSRSVGGTLIAQRRLRTAVEAKHNGSMPRSSFEKTRTTLIAGCFGSGAVCFRHHYDALKGHSFSRAARPRRRCGR